MSYLDHLNYFDSIQHFAEEFLIDIFNEAENFVNDDSMASRRSSPMMEDLNRYYFQSTSKMFEIWPTVGEFTVQSGAKSINGFLSSFTMMEEWIYAVYFIKQVKEPCSDLYQYQVIWCIPTPLFPIAQVTASIFFTIEVSKIVPRRYPVQVTLKFEGNGSVQTPDDVLNIDDDRLNWILDTKLAHFCRFKF